MSRFVFLLAAWSGLVVAAGVARGADGWTQLRPGMTSAEALKFIGEPLMRTKARGVERWIYDGNGEAVFFRGPLMSWTAATPSPESVARPLELDVLMRSARPPSSWTPRPAPAPASTYEREMAMPHSH
jgi:hypothetical protein